MVSQVREDSDLVQETWGSLCSQISTSGTGNVKRTGLSLQRERCTACFFPTSLTADVNSLVTFELSVWSDHTRSPRLLS